MPTSCGRIVIHNGSSLRHEIAANRHERCRRFMHASDRHAAVTRQSKMKNVIGNAADIVNVNSSDDDHAQPANRAHLRKAIAAGTCIDKMPQNFDIAAPILRFRFDRKSARDEGIFAACVIFLSKALTSNENAVMRADARNSPSHGLFALYGLI